MITSRVVKSTLKNNIIKVTVPDLGYELHYEMTPIITVDPITKYDDGLPDFGSSIELKFIKTVKLTNAKTHEEVSNMMRKESIIPYNLTYDHILVGFVYDEKSQDNHRWWLDLRDTNNQSVYTIFGDKIEINGPTTTKSWHDPDPNGIWHGRFVLSASEVKTILEPDHGVLIINSKLKSQCKPLDANKVCSLNNVPEGTESLRLRYNIREDIWFADILDKQDKQIGQIPCKSIICDAKQYGVVTKIGDKALVSMRININDISEIAIAINSLIIRGK